MFVVYKPPNLWYFIITAWTDKNNYDDRYIWTCFSNFASCSLLSCFFIFFLDIFCLLVLFLFHYFPVTDLKFICSFSFLINACCWYFIMHVYCRNIFSSCLCFWEIYLKFLSFVVQIFHGLFYSHFTRVLTRWWDKCLISVGFFPAFLINMYYNSPYILLVGKLTQNSFIIHLISGLIP